MSPVQKGVGIHDNDIVPCLVFERASEGALLGFITRSSGNSGWSFALKVLEEVGSGISALHKKGIAHRYIRAQ
jgi:serine/threonine protein kinase